MFRHPTVIAAQKQGLAFPDIVIRREQALESLRASLLTAKGTRKYNDPDDRRVIYASPLVDVAANVELAKETLETCRIILELTNWQIRLLSKSNLLTLIAAGIPDQHRHRLIFGVSTGPWMTASPTRSKVAPRSSASGSHRCTPCRMLASGPSG